MTTSQQATRPGTKFPVYGALAADLVLVIIFAAVGRRTHHEGVLGEWGVGLLTTAWPFVVALAVGWFATKTWRFPYAPLRTGAPLWAVTLTGGMALRAITGAGTALPFVLVAAGTLLVFLVGWRLLAFALTQQK